jgi:hypothetical protein
MSNSKTAIQEIKKLMKQFGFMSDEPVLKSFKLEDNTIVEAADLKVGEAITKISEEFERVALEDGAYRLVENFNLEVKEGKIVSVNEIFLDAKLMDGTIVKVEGDGLVEGAAVKVVTEEMPDGVPAPDGVHELEDGTKIETMGGIISKIEEKIEEAEPAVEIEVEAAKKEDMGGMEEVYSLLKDMMEKISEKMKSMEDKMSAVEADFDAFKKAPAAKKIADGKTDFNKTSNSDDEISDRIMALRKLNK